MRGFRAVIKWLIACLFGALVMGGLSSCGEGSDGDGGGGTTTCREGPYEGTGSVDLQILTPLPAELTPPCAGDGSLLGAVLLVPEATTSLTCDGLTVTADRVSGCCPGVTAERTVDLVMLYRVPSLSLNLGEQTARINLNDPERRVVGVSFVGQSFAPQGSNLADWCAP